MGSAARTRWKLARARENERFAKGKEKEEYTDKIEKYKAELETETPTWEKSMETIKKKQEDKQKEIKKKKDKIDEILNSTTATVRTLTDLKKYTQSDVDYLVNKINTLTDALREGKSKTNKNDFSWNDWVGSNYKIPESEIQNGVEDLIDKIEDWEDLGKIDEDTKKYIKALKKGNEEFLEHCQHGGSAYTLRIYQTERSSGELKMPDGSEYDTGGQIANQLSDDYVWFEWMIQYFKELKEALEGKKK